MSRQVDLTQPLSDEDRQYLEDRADTVSLARNAAYVAGNEFNSSDASVDPAAKAAPSTGDNSQTGDEDTTSVVGKATGSKKQKPAEDEQPPAE